MQTQTMEFAVTSENGIVTQVGRSSVGMVSRGIRTSPNRRTNDPVGGWFLYMGFDSSCTRFQ